MARRLPPKPGRKGPGRAAQHAPGRPPRKPGAPRPAGPSADRPRLRTSDGPRPRPAGPSADRPRSRPRTDAAPPSGPEPAGPERLQKVLAAAGFGSRRACEELIAQGRVSVNGTIISELGTKVEPGARLEVDGQRVQREKLVYLLVHKPRGYVSSNADPAGKPLVVDLVSAVPERVYTVGRLDEDSTGLMLLTNDGELANRLAHPRFGVEKVYKAVVAGHPTPDVINKLMDGVWLSDGKARARRVRVVGQAGDSTQVEMVLAEGKNREVRRMWAKLGHKVMRLNRVAIGPLTIKGIKPGGWRNLTAEELQDLKALAAGRKVPTAWFNERDPVRRESRPRRGPARHEYEQAARSARTEEGRDSAGPGEKPQRPLGPRGAAPQRPLGPRADRQAADGGPAGPRPARPAGPRGDRPAGPRAAGPRPGRPAGPGARGPAGEHRAIPPRDPGLTGRPPRRPRDQGDDSMADIEIPPAYAALPPSQRKGDRPLGPGPRGPRSAGPRGGRPPQGPAGPRRGVDPELGNRRVIGLEPESGPGDGPRRPRPTAKRARPLAKPRRETPPGADSGSQPDSQS